MNNNLDEREQEIEQLQDDLQRKNNEMEKAEADMIGQLDKMTKEMQTSINQMTNKHKNEVKDMNFRHEQEQEIHLKQCTGEISKLMQ